MRTSALAGALLWTGLGAVPAVAATLDDVRDRGALRCGVHESLAGFASADVNGTWSGFNVALCRAVAAAVLADPAAVDFVPVGAADSIAALTGGEIDVLARNTVWTLAHDAADAVTFAAISLYDGQGFVARREEDLSIASVGELDGARICVQAGTVNARDLPDYFHANEIGLSTVAFDTLDRAVKEYAAGGCDVLSAGLTTLAAVRATFEDPSVHVILPETIARQPLGLVVRQDDSPWADIVGWTVHALVAAEGLGITSANVGALAEGTDVPEINRLLGTEGALGAELGLDPTWGLRAIQAGGNYGEIFERHIGENTPIGLARGLNAQWTDGGLLYAPPLR